VSETSRTVDTLRIGRQSQSPDEGFFGHAVELAFKYFRRVRKGLRRCAMV
jgi:hypothetical protein